MTDTPSPQAPDDEQSDDSAELTASADGLAVRQEFQMRYALAQALGDALPGTDEDYYDVFGWKRHPTVEDYFAIALRNPYAYAVTFLPPELTWRDPPTIVDDAEVEDGTEFESDVEGLADDLRLWHYCRRADKLAGIGKFGVLVLQFDDIDGHEGLTDPVDDASELLGFRPFSRASVTGVQLGEPGTERWDKPTQYTLDFSDENETEGVVTRGQVDTVKVHWTRVIHIPSDELLDDEIRGIERQKPVYNNLVDIERTLGAAGQLAYRAAAWGIHINIDKDFELEDAGEDLREHLKRWNLGLENVLRTQGADEVKSLGGEQIDPSGITDPNIEAISAHTGIPQSVLKGNETGERATTQDLADLYGQINGRRREFAEPLIVRAVIDRARRFDVIADPRGNGYSVNWSPLFELPEDAIAEMREQRARTLQTWGEAITPLSREQEAAFIEDGSLPTELPEAADEVAALEDIDAAASRIPDVDETVAGYEALADGGEEAGEGAGEER